MNKSKHEVHEKPRYRMNAITSFNWMNLAGKRLRIEYVPPAPKFGEDWGAVYAVDDTNGKAYFVQDMHFTEIEAMKRGEF